jgi:two-component system, LytTR family, response regulator LytT
MDHLKILIVEDELIVAEDIRSHLIKMGYTVTGIAASYDEAVALLNSGLPDLVMLDIMIKGSKTGIDLGRYVREHYASLPIIYLTSLSDKKTIEQVKETHPDAFLLKPFRAEHLFTSIEIAIAKLSLSDKSPEEKEKCHLQVKDSLFLKKDNLFYKVKIKDILFFKAEGNYLVIYVSNSSKYTIRLPVKEFVELLTDYTFFQVHKSYVINLEYVDAVSPSSVRIKTHEIPLSKNKRDEFMALMQSFS